MKKAAGNGSRQLRVAFFGMPSPEQASWVLLPCLSFEACSNERALSSRTKAPCAQMLCSGYQALQRRQSLQLLPAHVFALPSCSWAVYTIDSKQLGASWVAAMLFLQGHCHCWVQPAWGRNHIHP
jgi:hypothetical protein